MKPNNIVIEGGLLYLHWDKEDVDTWFPVKGIPIIRMMGRRVDAIIADVELRGYIERILSKREVRIKHEDRELLTDMILGAQVIDLPIMPPTDLEFQAYVDKVSGLVCERSMADLGIITTPGKSYPFSVGQYRYIERFGRNKPHWDVDAGRMVMQTHNMSREGSDQWLMFTDDRGVSHRFLAHPDPNVRETTDHDESLLWTIFHRPVVDTIKERLPDVYESNMKDLSCLELFSNFEFFPGQKDFIARVACKDFGYISAETGCGKTLIAISIAILKKAKRVMVIAPRGTVKGSDGEEYEYDPAQWEVEINRFVPHYPVFHLFSKDDYYLLREQHGELPEGFYITYPEALLSTGAREHLPSSWGEMDFRREYGLPVMDNLDVSYSDGLGETNRDGIKCIACPSLATLMGDEFDMVVLDEAHYMQNMGSLRTSSFLRLSARYRYAFSATPIPNIVTNIFAVMGWLCVPHWYKNFKMNSAWPFYKEEEGVFARDYLVRERDYTAETIAKKRGVKAKSRTVSPTIASPARLLRLLKSTVAFIDKKRCNPAMVPCRVKEVRVPMGQHQRDLYGFYMNQKNIAHRDPAVRVLLQQSYLREICADPSRVSKTCSPFNPKLISTLEIVLECLERGEQVVVVSARLGFSTEVYARLSKAGIKCSRIDSTSKNHSKQSNDFKAGRTRVMVMGIKMAQAFSFSKCCNLVITSLEWSYGTKNQAMGRVYRLDSKKPVNVWCILNENSIEEVMYDKVSNKADAATLCLRGERAKPDSILLDSSQVIGEHMVNYHHNGECLLEDECERQWPDLLRRLSKV